DHHRLRQQVRRFAETEIAPHISRMEEQSLIERELATLIARQGWVGATIPAEYGGMAAGHLAKTIVIEELARVSGAMGAMAQASMLGTAKLLHYGSEVQKR